VTRAEELTKAIIEKNNDVKYLLSGDILPIIEQALKEQSKDINTALKRFNEIVNFLECECDSYNGFTCSIHEDRAIAAIALKQME